MVAKGNADKHRSSLSGIPAVEEEKHGRQMARSRYGEPQYEDGAPPPADRNAVQGAGDPASAGARPRGYANDVPESSWLRGGGKGGEGMPNFDKQNAWRGGKLRRGG